MGADALLRRNLLIYGVGGLIVPFVGIKLIDMILAARALGLRETKAMAKLLLQSLLMLLAFTLLTGLVYPFAVTGIAQLCCARAAGGSLIYRGDRLVGSELLGQPFDQPRYFWSRPSATSPQPYNGLASGGSNLGPTNPAQIRCRPGAHRRPAPDRPGQHTAHSGRSGHRIGQRSGSGYQPGGGAYQLARVARARGLTGAAYGI